MTFLEELQPVPLHLSSPLVLFSLFHNLPMPSSKPLGYMRKRKELELGN